MSWFSSDSVLIKKDSAQKIWSQCEAGSRSSGRSSVRIKYGFLCLLTHWHVIDRHEAWGFGQVDQMDPVIFDIMQFSKPIFDGYNQNCIKIQLLSCWSLRHQPIKKNKQIMRNEASSKECTANSILPVRINLFLDYSLLWIIKSHSIHLWSIQMDTFKKAWTDNSWLFHQPPKGIWISF